MKKILKHVSIILVMMLIIFSVSFVLEDKTSYEYTSRYEEQPAVYVTKYGDCYHSIGCHYLSQSMREKGLYEALDSGYRACSYCKGISYGTTQVEHREYYEVTDYTNAITYSCLRAVFITLVIYLLFLGLKYQDKLIGEKNGTDGEGA